MATVCTFKRKEFLTQRHGFYIVGHLLGKKLIISIPISLTHMSEVLYKWIASDVMSLWCGFYVLVLKPFLLASAQD